MTATAFAGYEVTGTVQGRSVYSANLIIFLSRMAKKKQHAFPAYSYIVRACFG